MKLENQVVSLELAKKLKELGVGQEINPYDAYWVKPSNGDWKLYFLEEGEDSPEQTPFEWCRAFTVAELGEMLPPYFSNHKRDSAGDWICYDHNIEKITDESTRSETETDARAKMLIYLIENKLMIY